MGVLSIISLSSRTTCASLEVEDLYLGGMNLFFYTPSTPVNVVRQFGRVLLHFLTSRSSGVDACALGTIYRACRIDGSWKFAFDPP